MVQFGTKKGNEMDYNEIAQECRAYAAKYDCDLGCALVDWEGDGPDGSWGMNRNDEYEVARILGIEDEFADPAYPEHDEY